MTINVGINGFGRIGRNFLRVVLEQYGVDSRNVDVVAVNDLTNINTAAHLLKYDSVMGVLGHPVSVDEAHGIINVGGKNIKYFSEREPADIDWRSVNVDVVIEATGKFTDGLKAKEHFASHIVISAPATNVDFTCVMGVNDNLLDFKTMHVISNASCTTNCLAPVVKVLDDKFVVVSGTMLTVHAYTGDQNLLDAPHKDLRRSRSAGLNIVPTSTGAAKAVGLVLPHIAGKLDGYALRVPVPTGSIVDFTASMRDKTTVEDVNAAFLEASSNGMRDIIEYCDAPIVSSDIVGNAASSIFDAGLTWVDGYTVRVAAWYDNEWGYSNRLFDIIEKLSKS